MQSFHVDPYPSQYQKKLQPCNSFNLNHPFNPTALAFDNSPNSKNITLLFKIFQHPRKNIQSFSKKFQILVSLSPPKSLSQFCPKPLSLSHPPTTLVRQQNALPLRWRTAPPRRKAPSFQVLSRSLSISHCLTLSLISPLSSHRFCSTTAKHAPSPMPKRPAHFVAPDRHLQGR